MSEATPDNGTSTAPTTEATSTTPVTEATSTAPTVGTTASTATTTEQTGTATATEAKPATEAAADPAKPEGISAKDWATLRADYAKGDEKVLKRLERYSSQEAVLDALIAAQNKIASGTLKQALPKDATPEQLADWRTENGIPESPEKYEVELEGGRTLGEADKPIVDDFLKQAHAQNMTPEQVSKTVSWYMAEQERQVEARHQMDAEHRAKAEETLRQEWGSEFKLNNNMINGLLDMAPEGVKDQLLGARLADGTPLGNDPATLRFLANLAREVNPVATVVPGSGGNAMQAIESEMGDLEKMMGDRKSEYWKGPKSATLQARYRDLVSVKQKAK